MYAIVHAAAEWLGFTFIQGSGNWAVPTALVLHSVSFVFLGLFGLVVIGLWRKRPAVFLIPFLAFFLWLLIIFLPACFSGAYRPAIVAGRIILGLPSGLLCAMALAARARYVPPYAPSGIKFGYYALALTFFLYAVLSGLFIDQQIQFGRFSLRVEIPRTICAVAIAVLYTTVNHYIEWEAANSCRRASQKAAQAEERRRVADELHDTVIQDLFALGLELENSGRASSPKDSFETCVYAKNRLNEIILKIRGFLTTASAEILGAAELINRVGRVLAESGRSRGLITSLEMDEADIEKARLSSGELFQLFRILEEGIRNASKYSSGSHLCVSSDAQPEGVLFKVECRGPRLGQEIDRIEPRKGLGYGLTSISHRTEEIGAVVHFRRNRYGRTFSLLIPWRTTGG
ncbi:MAG: hypothetical protein A2Y38_03735 [Spirochaetes bacterium GWB1_59_5]|nr:MAG: hypothetical protein A2Y38_03735 [Spirochaetes bacterium GWB1_59_5]